MDDELDELFGDAPPLQISSPLPKGLFQCVDELRLSGSCQYVAPRIFASHFSERFRVEKSLGLNLVASRTLQTMDAG